MTGYQAKLAQASASTRAFGANAVTMGAQHKAAFTTMGLAAAGMSAAIVLAFKHAISAAIEFESSFASVRKTVDATEQEFSALATGLRNLATEIPVDVNTLNEIAASAGQLGIAKEHILDFTRTIADLSVATDMTSEQASDDLARFANVMQMPQTQFDKLGSTIVDLGNKFASTESEIVNFGTRIAGAGAVIGLTESNVMAIATALSSVGVPAERGGTAVQKVLLEIHQSVLKTDDRLAKFAETSGMSADKFAQVWRDNPAKAFVAFVEGLGKAGDKAALVLDELEFKDSRLIGSFLSIAGAGDLMKEALETGADAWKKNAALTTEAEERYKTTASQIQLAKNQFNELGIVVGSVLLPPLTKLLGLGTDLIDWIDSLPAPLRTLGIGLAGAAGAATALATGMLLLLPRIKDVKAAMVEMNVATKLATLSQAAAPVIILATAYYGLKTAIEETGSALSSLAGQTRTVQGLLGEGAGATREQAAATEQNKDALHALAEEMAGVGATGSEVWDELQKLNDALFDMGVSISGTKTSPEEFQRALSLIAPAAGEASGGLGDAKEATEALKDEMEEALTKAEKLANQLMGLSGVALEVDRSMVQWLNALASLNGAVKDNGVSLDQYTQKGRNNRDVMRSVLEAARDHAKARADESGSVEEGARVMQRHVQTLLDDAEAAGFSRDEVRSYIEELNLTPKDIRTEFNILSDKAQAKLDEIKRELRDLDGMIARAHIVVTRHGVDPTTLPGGGRELKHAGGVAGTTGARRYGSYTRGDEISTILQRGEVVLSSAQAGQGGSDIYITVDARGSKDRAAVEAAGFEGVFKALDAAGKRQGRINRARRAG